MIRRWAGLALLLGVVALLGAGCGAQAGAIRIVTPTVGPTAPPATVVPPDLPALAAQRPTLGPLWAESPLPRLPTVPPGTATRLPATSAPAAQSAAPPPAQIAAAPTARPVATTRPRPPATTAPPKPTRTLVPSRTPKPTRTPVPSRTPKPTRTPDPTRTPRPPTALPTLPPPRPTATDAPLPTDAPAVTATPSSGGGEPSTPASHRYVVSKKARQYYYCDSDPAWHSLAVGNLEWFDTEAALLARYPALVLHAPCKD